MDEYKLVKETFSEIEQQFKGIELGIISTRYDEIWVDILLPDHLKDNDELENLIAETATDILIKHDISICFLPILKSGKQEAIKSAIG